MAELFSQINSICVFGISNALIPLKASFNNVKSEMHGPTCYQCL